MMHRYEALILSAPTITQDEISNLEQQFARLAEERDVTILSFDRWGKYRLAYPVRKNEYGVYFLSRFEAESPQAFLDEIKKLFALKLNDIVMRYLVNKLELARSLEYERPQSLDEIPEREQGDDLSKAKIERILTKADDSRAQRETAQAQEQVPVAEPEAAPAEQDADATDTEKLSEPEMEAVVDKAELQDQE